MSFLEQSTENGRTKEEEEEIRKLRTERGKAEGRLVSLSEVSFDSNLYGESKKGGHYVSSIPVTGDGWDDDYAVSMVGWFWNQCCCAYRCCVLPLH